MVIEKEYRGMAYTTPEQEKDLGYSVILKYYRERQRLIDGSKLYAMCIEEKIIYNKNRYPPEFYKENAIISADKNIANQVIEFFRLHQVCSNTLQEIYDDITIKRRELE